MNEIRYHVRPIGVVRSELTSRKGAPRQGHEGAPDVWIEVDPSVSEGLEGVAVGSELILLTWLHQAHREVLKVIPRRRKGGAVTGVFSTRSPDRPNPIGLHQVHVLEISGNRVKVGPLEAIDGTPVVDIKPLLGKGQGDNQQS